jgi:hypothetical protein
VLVYENGNYFRYRGSGFRQSTRGGAIVLAILPHGRLGLAAIRSRQPLLS